MLMSDSQCWRLKRQRSKTWKGGRKWWKYHCAVRRSGHKCLCFNDTAFLWLMTHCECHQFSSSSLLTETHTPRLWKDVPYSTVECVTFLPAAMDTWKLSTKLPPISVAVTTMSSFSLHSQACCWNIWLLNWNYFFIKKSVHIMYI